MEATAEEILTHTGSIVISSIPCAKLNTRKNYICRQLHLVMQRMTCHRLPATTNSEICSVRTSQKDFGSLVGFIRARYAIRIDCIARYLSHTYTRGAQQQGVAQPASCEQHTNSTKKVRLAPYCQSGLAVISLTMSAKSGVLHTQKNTHTTGYRVRLSEHTTGHT